MLTVNDTDLRNNLKTYPDRVADGCETLVATRGDSKNVMVISEKIYDNLMENLHLMKNKENYDWLMESKAQLGKGGCTGQNQTGESSFPENLLLPKADLPFYVSLTPVPSAG